MRWGTFHHTQSPRQQHTYLVDFEKLLSHHDERLAEKLNNEYLREEWDFGRENLGSRHMFKDPPVRCAEDRINMTRRQKRLYRHLKAEVNQSQRGVYRAKAGYIRERPLTAPDLSMYTSKDVPQLPSNFSAQTAYQIIQDKVKSARPGDGPVTDTSDRPLYVEAEPVDKPLGITEDDLQDAQKKFEVLQFDMETIDGRFQIMMDDTMNTYYPGNRQRHQEDISVSKPRPKSEILQLRKHEEITLKERPKSESHLLHLQRMEQASTKSAYPEPSVSRTQAKLCDARFNGWHDAKTKQGRHYPLVKQSLPNSYQGRLTENMSKSKTANLSKKNVKDDFLHQQTDGDQMTGESDTKIQEPRPSTAPVKMNSDSNDHVTVKKVSSEDQELSPAQSCKTDLSAADSCRTVDTGYSSFDDRSSTFSPKEDLSLLKSKSDSFHTSLSGYSERAESDCDKYSTPRSHSRKTSSSSRNNSDWKKSGVEIVPHMDHSKPRPISVGGMGTISLLENISEARYWEDAYNEEISDEACSDDSDTQTQSSADSGISRRQGDELQSSLALLKQRLGEQPVPTKAKRAKTKPNVLEKELRIKRQRRSQRPSSRTNQNLVNNSSSVSPIKNDSSPTSQKSNGKSGTRQAVNTTNKSLIHQAICKSSPDKSTSKQLSPSLHHKGQSTTGERKQTVTYSNNVRSNKSSKIDDTIVIELKKNPKIGRLMKRGEGLLSQDLVKKLIAAHA
ncbi:uncharacterized protein LOC110466143 [Mizuhopecten yessoensis]|uniref:Uncharacterized protein n=1 Tax=Mizuhopecten yessoensis TaxID=6573 RepID=A0A210R1Z4_MIZYE|nr:uncharacterized protein LOC110466143 [Mizuhopecten yessoensis]OWF54977.1 hypothetical protein KP79_PYT17953 [Mizuhopecten yessoensis]